MAWKNLAQTDLSDVWFYEGGQARACSLLYLILLMDHVSIFRKVQ